MREASSCGWQKAGPSRPPDSTDKSDFANDTFGGSIWQHKTCHRRQSADNGVGVRIPSLKLQRHLRKRGISPPRSRFLQWTFSLFAAALVFSLLLPPLVAMRIDPNVDYSVDFCGDPRLEPAIEIGCKCELSYRGISLDCTGFPMDRIVDSLRAQVDADADPISQIFDSSTNKNETTAESSSGGNYPQSSIITLHRFKCTGVQRNQDSDEISTNELPDSDVQRHAEDAQKDFLRIASLDLSGSGLKAGSGLSPAHCIVNSATKNNPADKYSDYHFGLVAQKIQNSVPLRRKGAIESKPLLSVTAIKHTSAHLETLILANNSLDVIPTFGPMPNLLHLDLSNNKIDQVGDNAFGNAPRLSRLDLKGNKICSLGKHALDETKGSLEMLDLSHNCLSDVPAANIRGYRQLFVLNLAANKIEQLNFMRFMNLPELKEVHLDNNLISSMHPMSFMNVPNLQRLILANNRLSELEANSFQGFRQLQALDLRKNKIRKIPSSAFSEMQSLTQLFLDGNDIQTIETLAFTANPRLQFVSIKDNQLRQIYRNAFDNCPQVTILQMDNNTLTTIGTGQFEGVPNLQQLHLSQNHLHTIAPGSFDACPFLTTLDLSQNRLAALPDKTLDKLTRLFWLDVSNNVLETVRPGQLPQSLATIVLHGNPLQCNTTLQWFIDYVVTHNVRTFLPRQPDVTCYGPANVRGVRLKELMIKRANETINERNSESTYTRSPFGNIIPTMINAPALPNSGQNSHLVGLQNGAGERFVATLPNGQIPRPLVEHVLRGGQIPGIPKEVLDSIVSQYNEFLAHSQQQNVENGVSPNNRPRVTIITGAPPLQNGFAPDALDLSSLLTSGDNIEALLDKIDIDKIPPQVMEKLMKSYLEQQKKIQFESFNNGSLPQEPSGIQTETGTSTSPSNIEQFGLSPAELMRRLPASFDLARLPPEILVQIAAGKPLNFAAMPRDLLEAFKEHNPDISAWIDRQIQRQRTTKNNDNDLVDWYRSKPTNDETESSTISPPHTVTFAPYDINRVDLNVDLAIVDPKVEQQITLYTLIGLGAIAAITTATVAYFCAKRCMASRHPQDTFEQDRSKLFQPTTVMRTSPTNENLTAAAEKHSPDRRHLEQKARTRSKSKGPSDNVKTIKGSGNNAKSSPKSRECAKSFGSTFDASRHNGNNQWAFGPGAVGPSAPYM